MKKVDFSEEFYKNLYTAIMDKAGDVEYDSEKDGYQDTFYVDDYEIDATVYYGWELHDDSFDHAFGTWHDPYPYMEVENLDELGEVKVYDKETQEELEGFDYNAFMAQFEEPFCYVNYYDKEKYCYRSVKVNSGEKVLYHGKEAIFLAKNKENGKLKIKTGERQFYVAGKYLKFLIS